MSAISLASLVAQAKAHEATATAIDRRTRAAARVAALVVGAATTISWGVAAGVAPLGGGRPAFYLVGWTWLVAVLTFGGNGHSVALLESCVLAGDVAICVFTRGFTMAAASLQWAVFGTVLAGIVLAVPLVVALVISLFDLGLWLAFVALCAIAGLLIVWLLLTALAN